MIKASYVIAAGALIGAAIPKIKSEMSELETTHYDILSEKLPKGFDGFKIVHLSDLHNKVYGKYNIRLFEMIAREKPDMIVVTGDMISHDTPTISSYIALIKLLCSKYPVYYVNGNHELSDMDETTFKNVYRELEKAGAVCLDNISAPFTHNGDRVNLCGLCYSAEFYRGVRQYKRNWKAFTLEDMISCINIKSTDDYTILLAHNPLDFDVHAAWGADLSFGGHIHGGFIRLPFVKGIISPELKLMPKYKEGIYYSGDSALVVSRGLGRIRFFNKPEIVCVTLHRTEKINLSPTLKNIRDRFK